MKSIFVSSTFRDMNLERDIIHSKVEPKLNDIARKYGETVSMCDLRWGINTSQMDEEKSALKVLNICLNEIDRCRPHMIVILGYRYGWMPGEKYINSAIEDRKNFHLEDDDISVTALEIEYGALFSPEKIENTFFYFREIDGECTYDNRSESIRHKEKLDELKQKICSIPGINIKTYHVNVANMEESMNAFADMVTEDMKNSLIDEWKQNEGLDEYALDRKKQVEYMLSKNSQFSARFHLFDTCMKRLDEGNKNLYIYGKSGSGKSTLISRIGTELEKRENHIVPIFCGYTPLCSTTFDIIKYIIWELENAVESKTHMALTKEHMELSEMLSHIHKLTDIYNSYASIPLTFIIDGIDQLASDNVIDDLQFISEFTDGKINFVISSAFTDKTMSNIDCVEVGMLDENEKIDVIKGILEMKHRELSDSVIKDITEKSDSNSPLYLSMIIQRLVMMRVDDFKTISSIGGDMESIELYQRYLVELCPHTLNELSIHVLSVAAEYVCGVNKFIPIIMLLAISRRGLRFSDMEGILKITHTEWNYLDIVSFIQYMAPAFIYRSDGRIDFSHKSIREGFLNTIQNPRKYHQLIAMWLESLGKDDEVCLQEIGWHTIKGDAKKAFMDILAEYNHKEADISYMESDLAECIIQDGGQWFMEIIEEFYDDPVFNYFIDVYSSSVFFKIPDSARNLDIKARICECLLKFREKYYQKTSNINTIWDMTIACERLAFAYRLLENGESLDKALKYANMAMDLRKKYLKLLQEIDTDEKYRNYLKILTTYSNIGISERLDTATIKKLVDSIILSTIRGLYVAHKDIAMIYYEKGDLENALSHMQEDIGGREKFAAEQSEIHHMVSDMEDMFGELALSYHDAAKICIGFNDEEHLKLAEEYCKKAIEIYVNSLSKKYSEFHEFSLFDVYLELARIYYLQNPNRLDEAIGICMDCKPVFERIHIHRHTDITKDALARLYSRLAYFYEKKNDEESRNLFLYYSDLSMKMLRNISDASLSEANSIRNLSIVSSKKVQMLVKNSKFITKEIIDCYSEIFRLLNCILKDYHSDRAYEDINSAYELLENSVKSFVYINETIRMRAIAEINAKRLDIIAENIKNFNDDYRRTIVQYATAADKIVEVSINQSDSSEIPPELAELLQTASITSDIMLVSGHTRSYQLIKKAVLMCEEMVEATRLDKDYDILAVTLTKYTTLSAVCQPDIFMENVAKLKSVAYYLYRKTNQEKYMQMIAVAQLLSDMFNKNQ